jgi:hypothetical protein
MLGPAWTGRARPPAGFFNKLRRTRSATRSTSFGFGAGYATSRPVDPGAGEPTSKTVSGGGLARAHVRGRCDRGSALLWEDRGCKPSTLRSYRNAIKVHPLLMLGEMALEESMVQEIERWRAGTSSTRQKRELSNKTKNNLLVLMYAIFRRADKLYGLPANPLASVDRFRVRSSGDIQVLTPEEVWALVRAASFEADAAIFLTAGVHRPAPRGAARVALARRQLHTVDDQGSRDVRPRAPADAEVRQGCEQCQWRRTSRTCLRDLANGAGSPAMTTSCSRVRPGCVATATGSAAGIETPWRGLDCERCDFTTSVTRLGRR